MTEDTSPENLRKFLESDDPAMVMIGLSMAKNIDLTEEIVIKIFEISVSNEVEESRENANEFLKNNYNEKYESMTIAYNEISLKIKELKQMGVVSNHLFQDTKLWLNFQKEFNNLFETLKNEKIKHLFLDDLIKLVHYEGCLDILRGVWVDSSDLNYYAQWVVNSITENTIQNYDECKGLTIREVYEKGMGKSVPWTQLQMVREFIQEDRECNYCGGDEFDGGKCIDCGKDAIGNFDFFDTSDIEQLCYHTDFKNFRMLNTYTFTNFGYLIFLPLIEYFKSKITLAIRIFCQDNFESILRKCFVRH